EPEGEGGRCRGRGVGPWGGRARVHTPGSYRAGYPPRSGGCRPRQVRRRRSVLGLGLLSHADPLGRRVPRHKTPLFGRDEHGRLIVRLPPLARRRRDRRRALRGRPHNLRLDPALGRRAPRYRLRGRPLRGALRSPLPRQHVRPGRIPPHARVRHHARATGRGRR
ncbi:Acetyl-CoA C-acyltransferase, partial [uncultured Rubrobacteraceae bacterium]